MFFKLKQYERAFNCLQTSLGIAISDGLGEYKPYGVMIKYSGIGSCLLKMGQYEEALKYLDIAIRVTEIFNITTDDYDGDDFFDSAFNRTTTYHSIGKCLMKLQKYEEAFPYLFQALEVRRVVENLQEEKNLKLTQLAEKSLSLKRKLRELANILHDLGLWYMEQNFFKKALRYLPLAFNLHKFSGAEDCAAVRIRLLTCHMELYQCEIFESTLKELRARGKMTSIMKEEPDALTAGSLYSFKL